MKQSNLSLREALDIFEKKNAKYFSKRPKSKAAEDFLKCHDAAHVVFACDTSLVGEGLVKIWTIFGTTMSFWAVIKGYSEVNAFQLFREYSFGHFIRNILQLFFRIPKAIIRARNMTKPWPFTGYEAYLDIPLSEIRKEFCIEIL